MITRRILITTATGALLLAACGKSSGQSEAITVTNAWARQSPSAATAGAAYFDVSSRNADALVSVSVSTTVAKMAQLHEMVPAPAAAAADTVPAGGMTETSVAGGMPDEMVMRHVEKIDLPAGSTVSLKPGGYHVMLMGLTKPLVIGSTIELTLTFGSGATLAVKVPVRETAP